MGGRNGDKSEEEDRIFYKVGLLRGEGGRVGEGRDCGRGRGWGGRNGDKSEEEDRIFYKVSLDITLTSLCRDLL